MSRRKLSTRQAVAGLVFASCSALIATRVLVLRDEAFARSAPFFVLAAGAFVASVYLVLSGLLAKNRPPSDTTPGSRA